MYPVTTNRLYKMTNRGVCFFLEYSFVKMYKMHSLFVENVVDIRYNYKYVYVQNRGGIYEQE